MEEDLKKKLYLVQVSPDFHQKIIELATERRQTVRVVVDEIMSCYFSCELRKQG